MQPFAQALLSLAALVLTLPPDYCCLFSRAVGCCSECKASVKSGKSCTRACSAGCRSKCGNSACGGSASGKPCSTPCRPCCWVCIDRVSTQSPDGPKAPGLDLALPVLLPKGAFPEPRFQVFGNWRPDPPDPDPPPINVLHCTWLC